MTENNCDGFVDFRPLLTQRAALRLFPRPHIDIGHHVVLPLFLLSVAVLRDIRLLSEDSENEVALLAWPEGARDDDVGAGGQSEPLAHLLELSVIIFSRINIL